MYKYIIWENKKLIRYSEQWYEWLEKVMIRRNCEKIWVRFTKNQMGMFELERVKEMIETIKKQGD